LLEFYREGSVAFDQAAALAELHVRWVGGDDVPGEDGDDLDGGPEVDEEYG
jgi:segregation and condensation protein A